MVTETIYRDIKIAKNTFETLYTLKWSMPLCSYLFTISFVGICVISEKYEAILY